jgi:hypothetical protein
VVGIIIVPGTGANWGSDPDDSFRDNRYRFDILLHMVHQEIPYGEPTMNKRSIFCILTMIALVLVIANSQLATACPSCYGNAQSSRIDGMNTAILTMVGIVGFVLTGISSFFVRMAKRSRNLTNSDSSITLMNPKEMD